jgi:hypothetical protein
MAVAAAVELDYLDKVLVEPEAAQHVLTPLLVDKADPEVFEEVIRVETPVVSVVPMVVVVVVVVMEIRTRVAQVAEH